MARFHRSLAFATLWLGAGCASPMTLPRDFVQLRDPGDGWRAVTSDDGRLRVRDVYESTTGNIDFWAEALRLDLVQQRGYEQLDAGEVTNADGATGRWFEFAARVQGERIGFFVAVWPRSGGLWRTDGLRVVEFAARDEVFRARLPAVRATLATVRD